MDDKAIIKKKQYFDERLLQEFKVPANVVAIEDWAFAHCKNLKRISLPDTCILFGKDCFLACNQLEEMIVYSSTSNIEHIDEARLLCMLVMCSDRIAYQSISYIGTKAWYQMLDEQLTKYIEQPDTLGFSPFLAGGEEDYEGLENDIDYYSKSVRIKKGLFVYERLLQNHYLTEAKKQQYEQYLYGLQSPTEAGGCEPLYILTSCTERMRAYYEIFLRLDLLRKETATVFLEDAKNYPELTAWLLQDMPSGNGFAMFEQLL